MFIWQLSKYKLPVLWQKRSKDFKLYDVVLWMPTNWIVIVMTIVLDMFFTKHFNSDIM